MSAPTYSLSTLILARKGGLILSGLLSAVGAALGLTPNLVTYLVAVEVFTRPLDEVNAAYIARLALLAVGAAIIKGLALLGAEAVSHMTAYRILYDIRLALARKLGSLPLGWFNQRATGLIKKVIHEDTEQLEIGLAHITPDVIGGLSVILLSTVALFVVDWRLALATIIMVPITLALFQYIFMRLSLMGRYEHEMAFMNAAVIQYLNGMKVIKAFTQAAQRFEALRRTIQRTRDLYGTMARQIGLGYQLMFVLLRLGSLITVAALGLWLYQRGTLDLPIYLFFIIMSMAFNRPVLNVIFHGMAAMYQVKYAAERVSEIFNAPSLPEPAQPRTPQGHALEFRDVSFAYDTQAKEAWPILNRVSFTAPAGAVTALVGPSGAGKTTIARLIPRFWDVTGGEVRLGGVNVKELRLSDLMDQVAFVFQDVFLFNDSVYENLRVGKPSATREEIVAAARAARCDEFIDALPGGYDYQVGENGARLSGGQRQRLSIARAILKDAPVIVLDEATAFVDPENESLIQAAIGELLAGTNKTLIVIAHRLSTIIGADQILVVDEGQIVARGTHPELLAGNALYASMWQAHTDARGWRFEAPAASAPAPTNGTHASVPAPALAEPFQPQYAGLNENSGLFDMALKLAGPTLRPRFWQMVGTKFVEGLTLTVPGLLAYSILLALLRPGGDPRLVWVSLGGIIVTFGLQLLVGTRAYQQSLLLDADIQTNLRLHLSDYLRRLPLGFFTRRDVGTIDSLFTTNLMFLELRSSIGPLLSAAVAPALLFLYLLGQDWLLALALASSVVPMLLILRASLAVFGRVWRAQSEARTRANSRMVEYIQGIHLIRAFNLAGERFGQFAQAMEAYRATSTRTITALTPWGVLGFFFLEMGFAVFLILGQSFYVNGSLSLEAFLLFLVLSMAFYLPLYALFDMLAFMRIVQNSVRNINAFLRHPVLPEPARPQTTAGFAIEFDRVTFSYGSQDETPPDQVLENVSLTIPERSFTALVGPSGSGKTTITNLIARFWDVDQGAVRVGGVDVRGMNTDALLAKVTLVFQDVYLFNDTVLNNLKLGRPDASDDEVFTAARLAQAHEFIIALPDGYETVIGEGGSTLSGGQKQRLSIARAILKDAPIILLDEATASIDPENEALIQRAFEALTKDKTLVVIAHHLSTVQNADQILVIDEGRIAQRGTHAELLAQPGRYRRFWEERQAAHQWKLGRAAASAPEAAD